jgi:3-methyladenine DNA glycosylase/8-oxoguanine DNA glycosylase
VPIRRFSVDPLDLDLTLAPFRHGRDDPSLRLGPDGAWRATRTAAGPATLHLRVVGNQVEAEAWGPGAELALDAAPDLVGAGDRPEDLASGHPVLDHLVRELVGLRIGRTGAVVHAVVDAVLQQQVSAFEADRSHLQLATALGEPAPGPAGLLVPPDPSALATLPPWSFHLLGVERRRSDVVRRVCARAGRLDGLDRAPTELVTARLLDIGGVGPWAAAVAVATALGDPDVVPLGDPDLPRLVGWALAGEADADDERMLALLAPWSGQRGRVVRLIRAGGVTPPRRSTTTPRGADRR